MCLTILLIHFIIPVSNLRIFRKISGVEFKKKKVFTNGRVVMCVQTDEHG